MYEQTKILALAFLLGCQGASAPTVRIDKNTQYIPDAHHFYVIGDWGLHGECRQKELAHTMQATTRLIAPDMIVSTGDNFYFRGVASTQDPQWKTSYEHVYDGAGLQVPWYVVLGNHDYQGNIYAQIDYTQVSKRWNMPSPYYTRTHTAPDGARIRFVYVDTCPFEREYHRHPKYNKSISAQDTTRQKLWMDSVLATPQADWKIVVGHHPFYAGGRKKHEARMQRMRRSLEPLFEKHQVDAYFAGHAHNLQHLYTGRMHYFISGAGSCVRPTGKLPYTQFSASIQGFMIGSITKKKFLVQVLSYTGERLYSTELTKP